MSNKRRPQTNYTFLKTMLIAGSALATFIGGDLLASQAAATEPALQTIAIVQEQTAVTQLSNAPVQRLIIPRPIAKTKSSK